MPNFFFWRKENASFTPREMHKIYTVMVLDSWLKHCKSNLSLEVNLTEEGKPLQGVEKGLFSVAVIKHKAVVAWRDCLGDSPEDLLRILANFISFYRGD